MANSASTGAAIGQRNPIRGIREREDVNSGSSRNSLLQLPSQSTQRARHEDRRALFLLVSLLAFLILSAFVTNSRTSEVVLVFSAYPILGIAALELAEKSGLRWPAALLAVSSATVMLVSIFHPKRPLLVANWVLLTVFLGFVAVVLFSYLDERGPITNARLHTSVSLYLIIAAFYYAVFNLIEVAHAGSFLENGRPLPAATSLHSLLYFSLLTLTTLGYGDIVPVSHQARIFATLESVTGVLYIAITVARLVAAYQRVADT